MQKADANNLNTISKGDDNHGVSSLTDTHPSAAAAAAPTMVVGDCGCHGKSECCMVHTIYFHSFSIPFSTLSGVCLSLERAAQCLYLCDGILHGKLYSKFWVSAHHIDLRRKYLIHALF